MGIYTQRIIAVGVHAMTRFYRFFPELLENKVSGSDYPVFFRYISVAAIARVF